MDMEQIVCSTCDLLLPIDHFYLNKNTGRPASKKCKQCKAQVAKQKYLDDKEYRELKIRQAREYYDQNKQRVLERRRNSPLVKEYAREYVRTEEFRKKNRARSHNARVSGAAVVKADYDCYDQLVQIYGERCMFPNCTLDDPIEIDHVVPISLGGGNEIDNLQLLCRFHNRSKKNYSTADYRK